MKKQTLMLALGLLFQVAVAQQTDVQPLVAEFDRVLAEHYKPNEPGATALVARNGQIIYQKGFGLANLEWNEPMQADHIFRIGSITKQFTAVAILQLMEQGKLSLQDEITRFIPDYPTQGNTITIEHLLTHTSGIQNYTAMKDYLPRMTLDMTPAEMIDHFKDQPMRFAPGTKWSYSNSNYFILGYIIERITGQTYQAYLEENFFKPLGMTNSLYASDIKIVKNRVDAYSKGDHGFENAPSLSMTQPYAAGSIQSTVEDLYKWQQAVQSYKLVKKESLDKAFTSYKLADGTETNYGYGWRFGNVQGSPTIEHGGAINGTITMAMYLPREDVFVAVFSNCDCNPPENVTVRLAALAIEKSFEFQEIPVEPALLAGYAGVYENQKGDQRIITVAENRLYSQRGRNPRFHIKAFQKDRFFVDHALLTLEFSRNKKGEIEKLITGSRQGTEVWTKTDKPFPTLTAIKVDDRILEAYAGEYEIRPDLTFVVTKEQDKLFVQATRQEKFEILAESETNFFTNINDAEFEFIKDESGQVAKVVLNQGGRKMEANKIR
jgi:CubicO group peptidase (beta-lactamase class C family)